MTDKVSGVNNGAGLAAYYQANVSNATDYYPFGSAMPGRSLNPGDYRFGFNGKENDANGEWGARLVQDYGFRLYNPAIGKFLSVDPLRGDYPELTPYQFASNTPIQYIDLDGLEGAPCPRPGLAPSTSNPGQQRQVPGQSSDNSLPGGPTSAPNSAPTYAPSAPGCPSLPVELDQEGWDAKMEKLKKIIEKMLKIGGMSE